MARRQITAKQSRLCRSLLHWNLHDVINKCQIRLQRLDHFERGIIRLRGPENDTLIKIYLDHGLVFTSDGDVKLEPKTSTKQRSKVNPEEAENVDYNELRQLERDTKKEDEVDVNAEMARDIRQRAENLVKFDEQEFIKMDADDLDRNA